MQLTSKDANKLLRELQNEKESLVMGESRDYCFVAATVENVETVRPEYDYVSTRNKIQELDKKIMALKHAINTFNVNTVVPELDMTIDQALVYIPMLTSQKMKLSQMKDMPKMARRSTLSKNNFIEYEYINFDLNTVKKDYETVSNELARVQLALDKINISALFEVEI